MHFVKKATTQTFENNCKLFSWPTIDHVYNKNYYQTGGGSRDLQKRIYFPWVEITQRIEFTFAIQGKYQT